jgi:hypothetical protein
VNKVSQAVVKRGNITVSQLILDYLGSVLVIYIGSEHICFFFFSVPHVDVTVLLPLQKMPTIQVTPHFIPLPSFHLI